VAFKMKNTALAKIAKQAGGNGISPSSPDLRDRINTSLGDINYKARTFSEDEEGSIDNIRHTSAGRYTAEAIQDKVKNIPYAGKILDFLGADKIAGLMGSNALGLGHELKTIVKDDRPFIAKLQEMGEDTFNNFVGSVIGSLDIDDSKKDEAIRYLSYNNLMPDGYVRTKEGEEEGLSENIYFKDEEGKVRRPTANEAYRDMNYGKNE
jgi:hypothetical protein